MTGLWRLRAAVLTLVGAIAVHEGRYLIAPPHDRHAVEGAHAYLPWLVAAAGALLFVAVAELFVHARRDRGGRQLPSFRALWLGSVVVLVNVFAVQECAEVALSHGHLPQLLDAFTDGAWAALPLALACAAFIALLLKGAAAVVEWALRRAAPRRRRPVAGARRPRVAVLRPRGSVLARRLAGRAPPVWS